MQPRLPQSRIRLNVTATPDSLKCGRLSPSHAPRWSTRTNSQPPLATLAAPLTNFVADRADLRKHNPLRTPLRAEERVAVLG